MRGGQLVRPVHPRNGAGKNPAVPGGLPGPVRGHSSGGKKEKAGAPDGCPDHYGLRLLQRLLWDAGYREAFSGGGAD